MKKLYTLFTVIVILGMFTVDVVAKELHNDVATLVVQEASYNGVDPAFALAIAKQESGLRCRVVSGHKAYGVMQIKFRTAKSVGYKGTPKGLLDCKTGIKYGMIYLKLAVTKAKGNLCVASNYYNRGLYSKPRTNTKYCRGVKAKMKKVTALK
jgi:soluble lytic murein transglycosylase-like protein